MGCGIIGNDIILSDVIHSIKIVDFTGRGKSMGLADTTTKVYTRENSIFADAFNFLLYGGEQINKPEALQVHDMTEIAIPFSAERDIRKASKDVTEKYRDVLKTAVVMQDSEMAYILLGIENQTKIHYAMPVRNCIYDALRYGRQITDISAKHKNEQRQKKKLKNKYDDSKRSEIVYCQSYEKTPDDAEFLSGFYKEDRLIPVITLVIHFGAEAWDGPLSLHEMMDVKDEKLLEFIQDYKIHLIEPSKLSKEDLEKFSTSLGTVLGYIKYSKDEEKLSEFIIENLHKPIDVNAARVIQATTHTEMEIPEKAEVVNVCEAIDNMMKHSEEKGRLATLIELAESGLISLADAAEKAGMAPEEFQKMITDKSN